MTHRQFFFFVAILIGILGNSIVGPGGAARAAQIAFDFTADIDGRDQLIIKGGTLQYQHFDWTPVGLHNPDYPSTIISTSLDGTTQMDQYAWTADWPNGTGSQAYSSIFTGAIPSAPSQDALASMNVLQARGTVTLAQLPTAQNQYTTIVNFDDNPLGSDAIYEVSLTFNTVPEPSSLMIPVIATIGVAGSARRRG
jgi:hypothetical protein